MRRAAGNLTRLTPTLWTGGDLPPGRDGALSHLNHWAAIGVACVIDNRLEWSDEELVAEILPDVVYAYNGIDDAGQRIPDAWFERGVQAAFRTWDTEPGAVVATHCHMGINRGPSMAYAILLALGWDPIVAIDHIRSCRPIAAVGYAEDALEWHMGREELSTEQRKAVRWALHRWRQENRHDTVRIIRQIRDAELPGRS